MVNLTLFNFLLWAGLQLLKGIPDGSPEFLTPLPLPSFYFEDIVHFMDVLPSESREWWEKFLELPDFVPNDQPSNGIYIILATHFQM
jgi:hypothetical protein